MGKGKEGIFGWRGQAETSRSLTAHGDKEGIYSLFATVLGGLGVLTLGLQCFSLVIVVAGVFD